MFCPPPVKSLGGATQPPGFMLLKYCNKVIKHLPINLPMNFRLFAYIFNRGVDASQANLLKNALSRILRNQPFAPT